MNRGVEYPVSSAGVDRLVAVGELRAGAERRVLHGGQVLDRALTIAGVDRSDRETVRIEVRTARHLPESEVAWIAEEGTVRQVAVEHVGLRLEFEDRDAEVAADRRRGGGRDAGLRRLR